MLCRKCGTKLSSKVKFCHECGTKVALTTVGIDEVTAEAMPESKEELQRRNPYVLPAFYTALLAFALATFPYPPEWGVGTSLPMRIAILLIALLSSYHSRKARQVNRLYQLQNESEIRPGLTKAATVLSAITALVALFAMFMI
ncbi:MAG: zinc ribbon domain-containing protein [Turicibacter sp.]|nr:zinc ribbon domain-containing protein [Turicibacter sp.]